MEFRDMSKIESPFRREMRDGVYVVTSVIEPGFEWVFTDPDVLAIEKLDGTNASIVMNAGRLVGLTNRKNICPSDTLDVNRFIQGVRHWIERGNHLPAEGQHFGELMGPQVQTNFLELDRSLWIPFDYLKEKASYRSYHKYPKTYENISAWFKDGLFSLMYQRFHKGQKRSPEGIVFFHPAHGLAKLRRDMFDWWDGPRHPGESHSGGS
ncbi:MAG: hypothetical protein JNK54_10375 [Elusimicrobia bacterium]|jgi:hypothetical protein|nr:hypothetical protein [Elusimicrobiota bacterium]